MPEEMELNAQKKELVHKHHVPGMVINKIKNMRGKEKSDNFSVIEELQALLPLTVEDVLSRGKEIAITFSNGYKLVFGLATGGYFAVDSESKLGQFPFTERTNFCMVSTTGRTIFVLECNNTQNQLTIKLKGPDEETFDPRRGPDPIESSIEDFEENILRHLNDENKTVQNYFERASLIELLYNQSLFNGLGSYTTTEVLHWLWLLKGVHPWTHGATFLRSDSDRKLLIRVIRTYFDAMLDFLKPGTPESKIDCNSFDERKWLDFRAIFVRCYRNFTAENRDKKREQTVRYSKSLTKCCHMVTTKGNASIYLVGLTEDDKRELKENGWKYEPKTNYFTPNALGVGMHNWWGPNEMRKALDSPVKEIKALVEVRPSTQRRLFANKEDKKRKIDQVYGCEEEELSIQPVKRQKIVDDNKKKRKTRPNKRNRSIYLLYEKMKANLSKTD